MRTSTATTGARLVLLLGAFLIMSLVLVSGSAGASFKTSTQASGKSCNTATNPTTLVTCNVLSATKLNSLPKNLTVSLAQVSKDMMLGCINGQTATAPSPQFTCVLGDLAANRTVVLFGDSHAWQWTVPLALIAKERGWKLVTYTMGNCPAEDYVFFNSVTNSENIPCKEFRNAVFAKLKVLRPSIVIMSSYTNQIASPASMTKTIDKLKADGSHVVFIEDTPYPEINVPDCLSTHPADIQKCSYSVAFGLQYSRVRKEMNQTAERDGALVIDPLPWLCTVKVCPPIIDNTVAYFDTIHISRSYALKLAPVLSVALASVMPGSAKPNEKNSEGS